ncbi:MAG: hypothetical protein DMG60_19410 [Acidobacteria bacterium]|nr:MAG: hypothetical protein DMG60_19410 [Acidobacteriota bacterium]
MIPIVLLLLLVAGAAAAIARLLRRSMEQPSNLSELLDRLEPFNVACFRHIASDLDDEYLKKRLPGREYRILRWIRLRAIHAYYTCAFRNSSLLLSYAQSLSRASDPELSAFGQQLNSTAIQLRLALVRGIIGIFFCYFTPLAVPSWRQITQRYDQIGGHLKALCETHAPDLGVAVSDHFSS